MSDAPKTDSPVSTFPNDLSMVGFGLNANDKRRLLSLLGELTSAQLPLPDLLRGLAEDAPDKSHRQALVRLADEISAGKSVTDALEPLLDSAAPALTGLTKAVLKSRDPAGTLFRILEYRRERADLTRTFWLRLTYPILLLITTALFTGIVLRIVSVTVAPMYESWGIQTNFLSSIIIDAAETLSSMEWFGLVTPAILMVTFLILISGLINISLHKWLDMAHVCRTLADLEESDCPLPEALSVCGAMTSGRLSAALRDMSGLVRSGYPLADAIEDFKALPRGLGAMVRWSESAGSGSAEGLKVAAALFDARGRGASGVLASLFTVLTIVFVTWVIFLGVVGIYLPMLQLLSKLSG